MDDSNYKFCEIVQDFFIELKRCNEIENFLMEINYCTTINEKMKYIDYMMNKTKYFVKFDQKIKRLRKFKNDEISLDHRRESKKMKNNSLNESAIEELNKSICYATNNSENLAIAYCWRSEINYNNNEYEKCLRNINLAKNCVNCPKEIKKKLIERETDCMKKLDLHKQKNINLSTITAVNDDEPKLNYPEHKKMPFIADCIGVKRHNNSYFLYAKKPLKSDECIAIEEIFAFVLKSKLEYKICSHCLNENNMSIMIPCDKCTRAMYCNEKCKMEAYNDYHKYECEIFDFLESPLFPFTFIMPFREVLKALSLFESMNNLIEFTKLKSSKVNIFANTYGPVLSNKSPSVPSVSTSNCAFPSSSTSVSNHDQPSSTSNFSSTSDSTSISTSTVPTSVANGTNQQNIKYSDLISFTKKDHYKAFYSPSGLREILLHFNRNDITVILCFISFIKRYMLSTKQLKHLIATDYHRDHFGSLVFHHLINNRKNVDYNFDSKFIGDCALRLALKTSTKPNAKFTSKNKKWMLITMKPIPANSLITINSNYELPNPEMREYFNDAEEFHRFFMSFCIQHFIRNIIF